MNKALLAKDGWKLEHGDSGLWAHIFQSKYCKGGTFLQSVVKSNSSHTWIRRTSTKDIVRRGCSGNGESTSFWYDKWLCEKPIAEAFNVDVPVHLRSAKVADFVKTDGTWDWSPLSLLAREATDLLSLAGTIPNRDDTVFWSASSDGAFSVSSAYKLVLGNHASTFDWKKIWKLDLPPRIRHFLWLAAHNRLLTREACMKRNISSSASCPRCGAAVETILHVLRDCPSSRAIWLRWLGRSRLDQFNGFALQEWLRYNLSRHSFLVDNAYFLAYMLCLCLLVHLVLEECF